MDKKRKQPAKKNHLLRQCIIEFDRFPKGNPRKAGAGVIVHDENGDVIHQVSEGLEKATSNEVEYRALTRGLKCALDDGFDGVRVRGDSKLVRKQFVIFNL
ncbi:hypothetical protein Ddye_001769 [Dipteronia dyeriana]|uniref:RNase H type-1 domain-containing protein n=1 Tax=Dipteronia dyeriana TaxID=168575 RepID=A0AAD9XPI7_9ROSI|nr:hypothetical protein Ddye_001769 [Dipteronia dyeriana]